MKHGELRRIACGHVVPRIRPECFISVASVLKIVALRGYITVICLVVGNCGNAESLSAFHQMLCQQVILKVRSVRRIARFHLKSFDSSMEFCKGYWIVFAYHLLHLPRLRRSLIGVVSVQIITVLRCASVVKYVHRRFLPER